MPEVKGTMDGGGKNMKSVDSYGEIYPGIYSNICTVRIQYVCINSVYMMCLFTLYGSWLLPGRAISQTGNCSSAGVD